MAQLPFKVTELFELEICKYTSSPYAVCVDSLSSALYLCLIYEKQFGKTNFINQKIKIPNRTYPSVPCEIINAGFMVEFKETDSEYLEGSYCLEPTNIWDSALLFSADMYIPNQTICLSFSGAFKNLKLGKGGCILTDNLHQYEWLKRARNSGRGECSYHEDDFSIIGKNCYLLPEISARALVLMSQFYDSEGNKIINKPLRIKYPDLSKYEVYKQESLLHKLYKEIENLKK
jgi:dTDP-4-amino-4,6-dideoxygalactose transaminase